MVFALYRAKPWRLFGRSDERPHDWAVHSFGQCGYWCSRVFSEEVRQESRRDIAHIRGEAESPGASVEEIFVRLAERHHPDGGPHKHTPEQESRWPECNECERTVRWLDVCPSYLCESCCARECESSFEAKNAFSGEGTAPLYRNGTASGH